MGELRAIAVHACVQLNSDELMQRASACTAWLHAQWIP